MDKYCFHRKLFRIKEHPITKLFEDRLFFDSTDYTIEPTVSIEDGEIHPNRLDVIYAYDDCYWDNINKVAGLIDYIQKEKILNIDTSILDEVLFNNIIAGEATISSLFAGYDIRDKPESSRVKVSLNIKNSSNSVSNIIKLHGKVDVITKFISRNQLLFTIEMGDGVGSRVKIYPVFLGLLPIHRERLSQKTCKVIYRSPKVFISFDLDMSLRLDFCIFAKNRDDVCWAGLGELFDNPQFAATFDSITDRYEVRIITVREKEFARGEVNKINIYY